jgi:hypothetical protein
VLVCIARQCGEVGIGGADSTARQRRGEMKVKGKSECDAWVWRHEAKRVSKAAAVWGVCGGVLAGSGGEGGVSDVVAIGMAGGVGQRQVALRGGRSE